ncbi:hypothetical protein OROHE_016780 [Orobanche hederae]
MVLARRSVEERTKTRLQEGYATVLGYQYNPQLRFFQLTRDVLGQFV